MSVRLKTFLALIAVLTAISIGAWFGWRAWAWPVRTLSNGWKLHVARSWHQLDLSDVPELSRPLLFIQPTVDDPINKLVIIKQEHPSTTPDLFVSEMTTMYGLEQNGASVIGKGYLDEKTKSKYYVLLKGTNQYFFAVKLQQGNDTFYAMARYSEEKKNSFGAKVQTSLRSLR